MTALILFAACGDDGGGGGGDDTSGDSQGCVEAWQCSTWETNGTTDNATRTCTDTNMCGTTTGKPLEMATLPPLDLNYYECNVEPVLTHGCSMLGCHGTETGRAYRIYARGRLRMSGPTITETGCPGGGTYPLADCIGNIECRCWSQKQLPQERRKSFDSARGFAIDAMGSALADKSQSELLKQPLVGGGFAHAGISMWTATDPDYMAVKSWLDGATRPTPCNSNN